MADVGRAQFSLVNLILDPILHLGLTLARPHATEPHVTLIGKQLPSWA
jgi:hypothetical protein